LPIDGVAEERRARLHCDIRDDTSPEAREAFEEIAGFFDEHLGKYPPPGEFHR
jgi:hypothetical protein